MFIFEPSWMHMRLAPGQTDKKCPIDIKEIGAFPNIGGECYASIYLGISMDKEEKEEIIKVARKRNPDIKIYQMTIDPNAFRLKEYLIEQ